MNSEEKFNWRIMLYDTSTPTYNQVYICYKEMEMWLLIASAPDF